MMSYRLQAIDVLSDVARNSEEIPPDRAGKLVLTLRRFGTPHLMVILALLVLTTPPTTVGGTDGGRRRPEHPPGRGVILKSLGDVRR